MRLTNAIRENVIESEINKKFSKALVKAENDFKKSVERQVKKESPKIPERLKEYIAMENHVRITGYDDYEIRKYLTNKRNLRTSKPYPRKGGDYYINIKMNDDVTECFKKLKGLHKEKDDFESSLKAVLYAYTTVKKLTSVVPELASHFKDQIQINSMAMVPVSTIEKVRKDLGGK